METNLHKFFGQIHDPRLDRKRKHLLIDIIILTVIAVISGADSWDSIEAFGKAKQDFLKKFLRLPGGIPSHDTINRVISLIRANQFEKLFIQWVETLKLNKFDNESFKEVIAIDGKTVKGSKDSFHQKKPIHLINAWACTNGLALGQSAVDCKTNEIKAIPELLNLLEIEGSIITIDAMGTQTEIAEQIIGNGADYILALKSNQKYLKENVETIFNVQLPNSEHTTIEKAHGRIETRQCEVINDLKFLDESQLKWKELTSIVKLTSTREIKNTKTTETRWYISSLDVSAQLMNQYIRDHWQVENSLHWTLDVTFREDYQRKRNANAAQNFATIQKIALNMIKSDKVNKGSLKTKRLRAGWDEKYLQFLLGF
jgi:predicted transposase YbfD/YdcC